jgi:hypothetical protein
VKLKGAGLGVVVDRVRIIGGYPEKPLRRAAVGIVKQYPGGS